MSDKQHWESVAVERAGDFFSYLDRMSVPGGWIYRTLISTKTNETSVATTFVPFARYSGDDLVGRFATSPHNPKREPPVDASAIPNFSQPVPVRDR